MDPFVRMSSSQPSVARRQEQSVHWTTAHLHPDPPIGMVMSAVCAPTHAAPYRRRRPERTLLYRAVRAHLAP